MKKLYFLLFFTAVLAFSCSKDSLLDDGPGYDRFPDKSACKVKDRVIKVYPGDNLATAFENAKALGKGSVVKLMPGVFKIGWTEIREFNGTFTGSGKGVSIITNLPDLDAAELTSLNKIPALITFIGGDVTVSKMSVQLSEGLDWLGTVNMSMLLFSDYTADFVPAKRCINVNLDNIDLTGLLIPDVELWPGGPKVGIPYTNFHGAMLVPDKLSDIVPITRSNINIIVSNSSFENFDFGLYAHGCGRGNLAFGILGKNTFSGNNCGLRVNENIGVNVKIMNNTFNTPQYYGSCLDLNTGEEAYSGTKQFEDIGVNPGTYYVINNTFNVSGWIAIGMMDTWRKVHTDNPTWMKMIIQNNTFNLSGGGGIIDFYCAKNVLFSNNTIIGDGSMAGFYVENFWWEPTTEYNISEGVKIINNLTSNVSIDFWFWCANNCLLMGDLRDFVINDFGENNKIIDFNKTNNILGETKKSLSEDGFLIQAQSRKNWIFVK